MLQSVLVLLALLGAACAAAADLVVVQVAPFSGNLAPTGRDIQRAAKIYFDSVNASGGVNGHRIRFVHYDDGYKTEQTVKLVREALERDRPIAFLGLVGTGNVETLVRQGSIRGVPVVGVRTGAATVRKDPQIFHLRASYADETDTIISHLATLSFDRIAVLYQGDSFGEEGLAAVNAAMRKHQLKLVAAMPYEKNTTKVDAAVAAILKVNPQAVIMIANTAASAEFVKRVRASGNTSAMYAVSVTDAHQVMERIGEKNSRGLVIAQVMPNPSKYDVRLVKEFRRLVDASGEKDWKVTFTGLEGYLMAKTLVEGLRRAGREPSRASLIHSLESMRSWDAGGMTVSFGPNDREGVRHVELMMLGRGGKLFQ